MKAFTEIRTWCRHSLTPAMALQTFTALIGVGPNQHEALATLLAELDARRDDAYGAVPGLHNLRWILFTPGEKTTALAPAAQRALILNLAFDGERDDNLEELLLPARAGATAVRDDVVAVLRHCEGFHGESADPAAFLRRREVPCGFVFRDIGPIEPERHSAGQRSSSDTADATLSELRDAYEQLTRFADFYSQHPPVAYERNVAPLIAAFLAAFEADPRALPLHRFEVSQPEEARWIRLASELMQRKQRRVARRMDDGVVRRGAHAKSHGLFHATFRVCRPRSEDEREYHVGVFERPGETFDAVLRASNGADAVNADRKRDLRGLSISLDVPEKRGRWLGVPGRQDFVLADQPVFFAANIQSFVRLLAVVELQDWRRKLWHGARLLAQPGALKQARLVVQSSLGRIRHPLQPAYHSAVPYQLGPDHIVKYSVEPSATSLLEPASDRSREDYLADALERSLDAGVTLDFYVHALPTSLDRERLQRAVEDATDDWSALEPKKIKLATIEIRAQTEGVGARARQAEEHEFRPWNALEQHRPLGNINRARRWIYARGAALRSEARQAAGGASSAVPPSSPSVARIPDTPVKEPEAAQ